MIASPGGIGEKWRVTSNGYRVSFGNDENVLKLHGANGGTIL